MSRRLVLILSVAAGVAVANLYYAQPLLPQIAATWGMSARSVASVVTFAQLGYAFGMLFIVPLGDKYERKSLILTMLALVTFCLLAVAAAPHPAVLMGAALAMGFTSVTPQLVVPLAAHLAGAHERGRVVGTVMSGLLVGILVARTASGAIGAAFGWRAVYVVAAGLIVGLMLLLWHELPRSEALAHRLDYTELLASLIHLVRDEEVLREASLLGAMSFGAFSAFWSTLPFLLAAPPYGYGTAVIGLFGMVGVTGILIAPFTGRIADRGKAHQASAAGLVISLIGYILFRVDPGHLWSIIAGIVLLDLGVTMTQIANQSRVYSLRPEARNRVNTVYMVAYFCGGSLGSFAGAWGFSAGGWNGYCYVAMSFILVGLAVFAARRR